MQKKIFQPVLFGTNKLPIQFCKIANHNSRFIQIILSISCLSYRKKKGNDYDDTNWQTEGKRKETRKKTKRGEDYKEMGKRKKAGEDFVLIGNMKRKGKDYQDWQTKCQGPGEEKQVKIPGCGGAIIFYSSFFNFWVDHL